MNVCFFVIRKVEDTQLYSASQWGSLLPNPAEETMWLASGTVPGLTLWSDFDLSSLYSIHENKVASSEQALDFPGLCPPRTLFPRQLSQRS